MRPGRFRASCDEILMAEIGPNASGGTENPLGKTETGMRKVASRPTAPNQSVMATPTCQRRRNLHGFRLLFSARRAEAPHASCSPVPDLTTRAGGRRATQARGPGVRSRAPAAQRRDAEPAQRARSVRGRALRAGVGCGTARHALRNLLRALCVTSLPLRPAEGPSPRLRRNAEPLREHGRVQRDAYETSPPGRIRRTRCSASRDRSRSRRGTP